MNKLLLGVIFIILFFFYLKPGDDYQPSQEEIQDLTYVDKTQYIKEFPYPQISNSIKQLSKGKLPYPINNKDALPSGDKELTMTRTTTPHNIMKQRMYLPDYYRKDRLGENPTGTEELRPFVQDNKTSESSWTDTNISDHPKFYNSEMKDEITNIGAFFDKNNQYNDTTSSNTETLPSDKCYTDKHGQQFCKDNTRLQLIPPSLITDPQSCFALNTVGLYKDKSSFPVRDNKVMNGGVFFNDTMASQHENETFSQPISVQQGSCEV